MKIKEFIKVRNKEELLTYWKRKKDSYKIVLGVYYRRITENEFWPELFKSLFSVKSIIVGGLLLGGYLYRYELQELYKEHVVCEVLNRFYSRIRHDLVAAIIWGLTCVYLIKRVVDRHRFHGLTTGAVLLVGFIYARVRFDSTDIFSFYTFTFLPHVAYFDIIFVALASFAFLFVINDVLSTLKRFYNSEDEDAKTGFLTDTPVFVKGKDSFDWYPRAEQLVKMIDESKVTSSFAIGINSHWGSGKSTFFNFVKTEIWALKNRKDYIIIEFNPWFSNEPKKIIEDFFSSFISATERYDSKLSTDLTKYADQLNSLSSNSVTKVIQFGIHQYNSASDISERYTRLNNLIKRLGKKIVIFIDDLDRLDKGEVVEVLRIVRNTSNFYNAFFLLAFDRKYINSAVESITKYAAEKYVDKIVQFEMTLPRYDKRLLNDLFLEKLFAALNLKEEDRSASFRGLPITSTRFPTQESANSYYVYFDIEEHLHSIRDIDRFINQFIFDYEPRSQVVDFNDYLILGLLKFSYPVLWDILADPNEREALIYSRLGRVHALDAVDVVGFLSSIVSLNSPSSHQDLLANHIDKIKSKPDYPHLFASEDDMVVEIKSSARKAIKAADEIVLLLQNLFANRSDDLYRGIRFETNYDLYFYQGSSLLTGYPIAQFFKDLNDKSVDVDSMIARVAGEGESIDVYKAYKVFRLFGDNYTSFYAFKKMVLMNAEIIFQFTNWNERDIADMLLRIVKARGIDISEEAKKLFFDEVIHVYDHDIHVSSFAAAVIRYALLDYCRKENTGELSKVILPIVNKEELQKAAYELLSMNSSKSLRVPFTGEYNFYSLLTANIVSIEKQSNRIILAESALDIFRRLIALHLPDFFESLIEPVSIPNPDKIYGFHGFILQIFHGLIGFEKFLSLQSSTYRNELWFKRVLKMYAVILALRGEHASLDDFVVSFDDYDKWFLDPDNEVINAKVEEKYFSAIQEIIIRILNSESVDSE